MGYGFHKCDGMPENVDFGTLYRGKKVMVVTHESSATNEYMRIEVTYCPFCGKRLDEGQTKGDGITLRVRPFDAHDGLGAYKVLEEAAEVQVAYKDWVTDGELHRTAPDGDTKSARGMLLGMSRRDLENEIADVIQAAVNLAHVNGLDLADAMERCTKRNEERGRYAV